MRVFVRVLDRRSLSTAATDLGVSLPTVSRILRSLEDDLGVRLIARTTRGLAETDSGRLYYRHCRQILEDLHEADAAVQSQAKTPVGELRITAPVAFGRHHVATAVASFLERCPRASCYLSLSDHCELLAEQRFDVAIRIAAIREVSSSVRRLGYVQRAVVGSRDYFARFPVPTHPQDLARHNCLLFAHYHRADEWSFRDGGRVLSVRVQGRLRTDNQEALVDAVLAGSGLAILPTWLIHQELVTGGLQRVLAEFEAPRTPVHAIFPTPGTQPNKVRTFVELVAKRLGEQQALASARMPAEGAA